MDACFHYQSPRSGENFDTFMQENAQTCIKMNACFHYHSWHFYAGKCIKIWMLHFYAGKCIKIWMLVFITIRRVAARILTFFAWKIVTFLMHKMNAFNINHRAAAKKNVDNLKNKFHAGKCPKECIKMNQVFYQVFI